MLLMEESLYPCSIPYFQDLFRLLRFRVSVNVSGLRTLDDVTQDLASSVGMFSECTVD